MQEVEAYQGLNDKERNTFRRHLIMEEFCYSNDESKKLDFQRYRYLHRKTLEPEQTVVQQSGQNDNHAAVLDDVSVILYEGHQELTRPRIALQSIYNDVRQFILEDPNSTCMINRKTNEVMGYKTSIDGIKLIYHTGHPEQPIEIQWVEDKKEDGRQLTFSQNFRLDNKGLFKNRKMEIGKFSMGSDSKSIAQEKVSEVLPDDSVIDDSTKKIIYRLERELNPLIHPK